MNVARNNVTINGRPAHIRRGPLSARQKAILADCQYLADVLSECLSPPPSAYDDESSPVQYESHITPRMEWRGKLVHPARGSLTQPYHPGHSAIDIAGRPGSDIVAAAPGVVRRVHTAGWDGGGGNNIVIDHGGGLVTRYNHLDSVGVAEGQVVAAGQPIGTLGSTGHSTGPHLDFRVIYDGHLEDPADWLA
jgi:murein DD-endopeptidase MepM/ murein hydrolase activator NlpD